MKIEYELRHMNDSQTMADYSMRDLIVTDDNNNKYPIDHYRLRDIDPELYKGIKEEIERNHPGKSICI